MKKSKTALITGGSRGLGKDMALNIAKKGINVIITYHSNESAAKEVVSQIIKIGQKAKAIRLDTGNIELFDAFFNELNTYLKQENGDPNFDFLINNAGSGIYAPFLKTTEEQFDQMFNIHLKGVYFLTQRALTYMNEGGSVINISSGLTRFTFPNSSAYASMKGAIEVFTRYLAKELGYKGITANVVAPGAIATDFAGGDTKNNEQKRKMLSSITPLDRVGQPEDIGSVVAFLCSDEAQWINGQRIEISGGAML